ncbi:MAG: trypsin-like peptidase domain-containing protein, partial [Clostridia bacterium]|nr:trypsin-like peptidase domain-containing protein [Clostridia bacterium]
MSIKKTVISVVSGAIAGGLIASVMTLSIAGNINKEYSPKTQNNVSQFSEDSFYSLSAENSTKEVLSVEEIAKRTGPSIVGIACTSVVQSYFGAQESQSGGSGIVIDNSGHIVTNYHVIEGSKKIKVKLTSGNEYDASVIGGDEKTDIAVIKINANEQLHVATLGNSDEVEVGSLAVAIGNP